MGRKRPRVCVIAAACLACLAGCQSTPKKPPHPDDPLLLSKKPAEGKQEVAPAPLLARIEPVVPLLPTALVAVRPPEQHVPAPETLPTSRPLAPTLEATPVMRRRGPGP